MAPAGANKDDKGVGEIASDLWQLTRDYAKQETIDPLRSLGRFLGYGIGGALALALAILFGALAILRGLQDETASALDGNWNVVPYAVTFVFTVVCAALALYAIKKPLRDDQEQR